MLSEKVQDLEQENHELKERLRALEEMYRDRGKLPKDCKHCRNFSQHYIRCGTSYYPTYDGHCTAGQRLRNRKPDDTCESFAKMEYGENCI